MKGILYLPLLLILMISCTSDVADSMPNAFALETITGKWYLREVEKGVIGQKKWQPVAVSQADSLIFRYDLVVLDRTGLPACCGPTALIINDELHEIKPKEALPANPLCVGVSCTYCPTWELEVTNNVLVVTTCNSERMKYSR